MRFKMNRRSVQNRASVNAWSIPPQCITVRRSSLIKTKLIVSQLYGGRTDRMLRIGDGSKRKTWRSRSFVVYVTNRPMVGTSDISIQ